MEEDYEDDFKENEVEYIEITEEQEAILPQLESHGAFSQYKRDEADTSKLEDLSISLLARHHSNIFQWVSLLERPHGPGC